MNNKSLMMQVHNYAKLWGVQVRVQGGLAYTDGTKITIPRFNTSDEHSCRLACAYLAHESGHIAYSDFDLLGKISSECRKLLYTLLNLVEDSRIEKIMSSKWIGVYENLSMLNQELSKIAIKNLNDLRNSTVNLIPRMLQITSWACQKYIQQYDTDHYILDTLKDFPKLKDFTYKLAELLLNAPMCNNTKDAYKLAKKIQALLTDEYNTIKGTSAGDADIKDNNDSDDNEGIEGNEDSDGNEDNKDSDDKDSSVSSDDFDVCAEIFGQSTLASALESSFSSVITNSTTRDDLGIISECPRVKAGSADWLHHTGLALKINSLTLALHNYVKARTLATSEQVDVGRRLNVKRAIRIPLGETRVWNKKTYDLDHNTSIHVLVDASSSMLSRASDGNFPDYKLTRCDHAKICAYCIAKALEGIPNTESQVTFFPAVCTKDDRNDDCDYEVGMCKQANESVQRTLKYFDQSPSGSTPMAQALAYALSKFKYSDKDRNIILIITDGMPDSIANVQRQLQQIEHLGVELRVLSINCETAQKLFPNCVVTDASVLIDNASKVIKQLFN